MPKGFIYDRATVPLIVRWVVDRDKLDPAALAHDWALAECVATGQVTRLDADRLFLVVALAEPRLSRLKAYLAYWGVRLASAFSGLSPLTGLGDGGDSDEADAEASEQRVVPVAEGTSTSAARRARRRIPPFASKGHRPVRVECRSVSVLVSAPPLARPFEPETARFLQRPSPFVPHVSKLVGSSVAAPRVWTRTNTARSHTCSRFGIPNPHLRPGGVLQDGTALTVVCQGLPKRPHSAP